MSGVQAVVCAVPGATPGNVAICAKLPLWATRPKKVTVRDAVSVSLPVAESVTDVGVPVDGVGRRVERDRRRGVAAAAAERGARRSRSRPPVSVPVGAPATLEAAVVPEPSLRP